MTFKQITSLQEDEITLIIFKWCKSNNFLIISKKNCLNYINEIMLFAANNDQHFSEKYLCNLSKIIFNDPNEDDISCIGRWNLLLVSPKQKALAFILSIQESI